VANKIGEGGFAVVFYGEIRGQVTHIINLVDLPHFCAVFHLFQKFVVNI
jgi:hypothetical protein